MTATKRRKIIVTGNKENVFIMATIVIIDVNVGYLKYRCSLLLEKKQ